MDYDYLCWLFEDGIKTNKMKKNKKTEGLQINSFLKNVTYTVVASDGEIYTRFEGGYWLDRRNEQALDHELLEVLLAEKIQETNNQVLKDVDKL